MFCPKCGTETTDDSQFCESCGTKLKNVDNKPMVRPVNDSVKKTGETALTPSSGRKKSSDMVNRKNADSKFHGKNILIIAGVILIISLAVIYLANFTTDVFARELSQEQVQSIVTNIVNEGVSDPGEMVTVGTPSRSTFMGESYWMVPVSYNGGDLTRREMLNGDVMVPVKAPRDEDNNYVLEIIFADGSTMEVVVTPNGSLVNINTPGVLPAPIGSVSEENQPTSQDSQKPTQSSSPQRTQQPSQTRYSDEGHVIDWFDDPSSVIQ